MSGKFTNKQLINIFGIKKATFYRYKSELQNLGKFIKETAGKDYSISESKQLAQGLGYLPKLEDFLKRSK